MSDSTKEKEIVYAVPANFMNMEGSREEDEIDLFELWKILWSGKWFMVFWTILWTLAAVLVSLQLPKEYKASATLISAQQKPSGLSGLIGNLPLPIALPGQSPDNIILFLESRTLRERLIKKHNLLPLLYKDLWKPETNSWDIIKPTDKPTVVKALQGEILNNLFNVTNDKKTGLIKLSWTGQDPAFCFRMLKEVINELTFFMDNEYVSNARREREFVERQLAKATTELEHWERQVPTAQLSLSKINREQFTSHMVYTELRKQLELAKITEAKQVENFEILDSPFVPELPYKPNKKMIVALAFVLSGFLAVTLVFLRHAIRNSNQKNVAGNVADNIAGREG